MKEYKSNLHGSKRMIYHTITLAITAALGIGVFPEQTQAQSTIDEINPDFLTATAELYGVSEEQAVDRLAKEAEAAHMERIIRDLALPSYAGSWIDQDSLKLVVAVADKADLNRLKGFGVEGVVVKYSLAALEDELAATIGQLDAAGEDLREAWVDVATNSVVIGVGADSMEDISADFGEKSRSGLINVRSVEARPTLSTGSLRAAVGTRNLDWKSTYGGEWPCSVGAAVAGGYVTAGHCGYQGNDMGDVSEVDLGEVQSSTWTLVATDIDAGWVDTDPSWTPVAQVYGYSNGIFSVSADWGGTLEYTTGSTVCRYGQTSGGPHCGTVNQKNVTVGFFIPPSSTKYTSGPTRVAGSCSDAGDSGGPHVSGTGQLQGINVGTLKYDPEDECPTAAQYTYFQPMEDAVNRFEVTILSSHGGNSPNMNSVSCPDWGSSGEGSYVCFLNNVKTQGQTTFLWTTNTGHSSTASALGGACSTGQTVNVTLKATNPYGTQSKNYSFGCPTNPIE